METIVGDISYKAADMVVSISNETNLATVNSSGQLAAQIADNAANIINPTKDETLSKLTIAQNAVIGTNTQALIGGSVTTAAPTYTTGTVNPLSLDTSGSLRVNVGTTTGSGSIPNTDSMSDFVRANKVYTIAEQMAMASSAADNPLILIKNPAASGKILYLYKVIVACSVTNVATVFKYFANPTITANGAAVTASNNNIGGGGPASVMLTYSLPTITANGTIYSIQTYGQNSNSISVVEDMSIAINPGSNFLITGKPGSNNREATITVVWAEV